MTSSIDTIESSWISRTEDAYGDEQNLVRAAQMEAAAFDTLYRRYVTRVYRYVRSRVADEQDALDLTQQIFLRALNGLPRYRPSKAPFGAWLFRIARNAVTDHHRRSKSSTPWDLVPESLIPVTGDNPELTSLRRESLDELRVLLGAQDAYRRELLALRFAGELTVREIAALLGKPEATVKSDLRRTLQRLKGRQHED